MTGIVILLSVFVLYALIASRLERLSITAPMVFVVAGVVFGESATNELHVSLTSEPVLVIVELTLALLLFADASTVRLREVEGDARLPARLLLSVETLQHAGAPFDALVEVATWTVLLSVMAHGVTAGPLARAYGRRMEGVEDVPELLDAPEPRRRRQLGAA